jgi:ribonuclease HI
MSELSLYTDGGVCGPNPSPRCGVWAWSLVLFDKQWRSGVGILTPEDVNLPTVSNNLCELMAAVVGLRVGLKHLQKPWNGTIYTDSSVTRHRLSDGVSFMGVPCGLKVEVLRLREYHNFRVVLLAGHPTKYELNKGLTKDKGCPVSKHNVWCDHACTQMIARFKAGKAHRYDFGFDILGVRPKKGLGLV